MLTFVVLIGLAAYRAHHLLAHDTILDSARYRFYRRFPPNDQFRRHYQIRTAGRRKAWQIADKPQRRASFLGQLIECPWCASVWLAGGITAVVAQLYPVDLPVLVWAGACSVAGLCATLESVMTRTG